MKISKEDLEIVNKITYKQIAMKLVLLETSDPDEWKDRLFDLNQAFKEIKKECIKLMKDEDFLIDNFYN